jgi:hypothetical protein
MGDSESPMVKRSQGRPPGSCNKRKSNPEVNPPSPPPSLLGVVKLEDGVLPSYIDFISILSAADWKERLALPKRSILGTADILSPLAILSHAMGRCNWSLELENSPSGNAAFTFGWDRFVHDSGLSYGNTLRFRYLGD